MTVQHVVLFRFPTPPSDADRWALRARLAGWPEQIGGFRRLRLGTDLNDGARSRGFQLLLLTEHDDVDALHAYQRHPVHQEFAAWVAAQDCDVLAFDYELTPDVLLVPEPEMAVDNDRARTS